MIIYKITNLINNKIYIGKTINTLNHRWWQHLNHAKNKKNSYLYKSMNKYGYTNFKIEEIEKCNSEKELNKRERYWIKFYNSINKNLGYNSTFGGDGGDTGGKNRGKKWSEGTRKKISETLKKRYANKEIINPMRGKKHTEEAIIKIKEKRALQIITKESTQKSMLGRKKTIELRGYYHTENGRKSIGLKNSIRLKGRTLPEEVKQKVSKTMKDRKINVGEKNPMFGKISSRKGKTYEEIYGVGKAKELRIKCNNKRKDKK